MLIHEAWIDRKYNDAFPVKWVPVCSNIFLSRASADKYLDTMLEILFTQYPDERTNFNAGVREKSVV